MFNLNSLILNLMLFFVGYLGYIHANNNKTSSKVENQSTRNRNNNVSLPGENWRECASIAFECYKPYLSYVDPDGQLCGWKQMDSMGTLSSTCAFLNDMSDLLWSSNVVQNKYKYVKSCKLTKRFQECVQTNGLCQTDYQMNMIISTQNALCDNLENYLSVTECRNAWDLSKIWIKLTFTNDVLVQAYCSITDYRQRALDSLKLYLFNYITYASAYMDKTSTKMNAEVSGRYLCKFIETDLCYYKRGEKLCHGYLALRASQNYYDEALVHLCSQYTPVLGGCFSFMKSHCPLNLTTGEINALSEDVADIVNVYNITHWHRIGYLETDVLLRTVNNLPKCDTANLVIKQLGCYHRYITLIDLNWVNKDEYYLAHYLCRNIRVYDSCFEVYINSSCPDAAYQLQSVRKFIVSQCSVLTIASRNFTCPLFAVFANEIFTHRWHMVIRTVISQYIPVVTWRAKQPTATQWKHTAYGNIDSFQAAYRTEMANGQISYSKLYSGLDIIQNVCETEEVSVYKEYIDITTGEFYFQLLRQVDKAWEYLKLVST